MFTPEDLSAGWFRQVLEILAVPRVVQRHSDINNLHCQTSLTALTGAKDIFCAVKPGRSQRQAPHKPLQEVGLLSLT